MKFNLNDFMDCAIEIPEPISEESNDKEYTRGHRLSMMNLYEDWSGEMYCSVSTEVLDELFPPFKPSDKFSLYSIIHVQKRKHRKNRINKKWLKKYGTKEVVINYGKFISKLNDDGTYEFQQVYDSDAYCDAHQTI